MLSAGFASKTITPPLGVALAGYGLKPERRAASVLDDLCVRAVVLDDGRCAVALVTCDIISLGRSVVAAARDLIARETKIPPQRVLISATHSHSAPTASYLRQWGELAPAYVRRLPQRIAAAVQEAFAGREPVELSCSTRETSGIAANRVRDDGPVDAAVRALLIQDAERLRAVLMNFACHPVIMPTGSTFVSADFPGVAVRQIEGETGAFGAFFQGCCGDINPAGDFRATGDAQSRGCALAAAALACRETATTVQGTPIRAATAEVELPLDPEAARKEALDYLRRRQVRKGHAWLAQGTFLREWACETLALLAASPPETLPAEIQAIALGDVVFVGLPGEIYTHVSLEIRERSPFRQTWTIGYANDNVGYLVDPRDYEEETYAAIAGPKIYGYLPFRPEAAEVLTRQACVLVDSLLT